jgi:hypothetical protein
VQSPELKNPRTTNNKNNANAILKFDTNYKNTILAFCVIITKCLKGIICKEKRFI